MSQNLVLYEEPTLIGLSWPYTCTCLLNVQVLGQQRTLKLSSFWIVSLYTGVVGRKRRTILYPELNSNSGPVETSAVNTEPQLPDKSTLLATFRFFSLSYYTLAMQGGRGCTWILSQRSTGHGDWFDQPTPTGLWATSSPTEEPGNFWKPTRSTVSSQSTNTSPFSLENTLSTSIYQLSSAALYPYLLLRNFVVTSDKSVKCTQ